MNIWLACSRLWNLRTVLFVVLWSASGLLIALTAFRAARVLPTFGELSHVAGSWTTMAEDLAHGVFYRPIYDRDLGYGGTRYFPLHFVIHAGLIKAGLGPLVAGHVIGITAIATLMLGTFLLLRNLGASRELAIPSAGLVLASGSVQQGLLTIKGDSLAAALCLLGLVACTNQKPRIVLAALFFTLAFAAKVTAVYAVAAAVVSLLLAGRRRESALLAVLVLTGAVLVVAAMYVASQGRVLEIFRVSAAAGGSFADFAMGPFRLTRDAVRDDAAGLPFLILGIAAVASTLAVSWRELPSVVLVAATGMLAAVYGSPGMGINHLVDLHVAAIVAIVYAISRARVPLLFGTAALALAAIAACGDVASKIKLYDVEANRAKWAETLKAVEGLSKPLLSENPIIPILVGERPYLLDPFLVRVSRERDPRITAELWHDLETQKFGAVVVYAEPRDVHFGPGFHEKLAEHYEFVRRIEGFNIYRPRPRGGSP